MRIYAMPKEEMQSRKERFISAMNEAYPNWDIALFFGRINQYYFTGTMQDGMLVIKPSGESILFVRRSFERAVQESLFEDIRPMNSYSDAAASIGERFENAYTETEIATLGLYSRLSKYFKLQNLHGLDNIISLVRSVKSSYELEKMALSGKLHITFMQEVVPQHLKEGISEADLIAELYTAAVKMGHHGTARFSMFQNEMMAGQIGFGESALYPTNFDGPGGSYGMSPAVPFIGSRERRLQKGDLVFIDIAFGVDGYHTDKTQMFLFGAPVPSGVYSEHKKCIQIQKDCAAKLIPGAVPSEIYQEILGGLPADFLQNFMGFGARQVKFLGHGVGLQIDELPIISGGYKAPLKENMAIALEPKKGIAGIGLVGVEDTYIVTPTGGKCITGGGCDIIEV